MAPIKRPRDQTEGPEDGTDSTRRAAKRQRVAESPSNDGLRGQAPVGGLPDGGRSAVVRGKTRRGVQYDLPPMTEFPEMMGDMVSRAMVVSRFSDAVKTLGPYKVPIATMCSGSEAPLIACLEFSSALARIGQQMTFDHLFSAEIVQYKQAYIERNFSPSIIFTDIRDMVKNPQAITAYGGMADVPDGVSLLVAGSSCVDFSKLNPRSKGIDDSGESGETFRAILHYARRYRPRAMILENVKTAKWDIIEAYTQNDQSHAKVESHRGQLQAIWGNSNPESGYSTSHVIVDSKDYYLPQTRARGYMICIDRSKIGSRAANQIAGQWAAMFKYLARAASSPMEELFLPADDPRILRAREVGHLDEYREKKIRKETKWRRCKVRYANYRYQLNLGDKRPLTHHVEGGPIYPPEHWSKPWASTQPDRLKEHWNQAHLRNARQGFDSQYKTRIWELSQNIDRATDSSPWGFAPCVTPTGVPFVTTRGGLLTSFESLRLQGQPLDRIDTGRISESNIQDLAGNAMSTTVVGAAIIALMTVAPIYLTTGLSPESAPSAATAEELPIEMCDSHLMDFRPVDLTTYALTPLPDLMGLAASSIRLCACEAQNGNTDSEIFGCGDCGHTSCTKCKSSYAHRYAKLNNLQRSTPVDFVNSLKNALPMRLQIIGHFIPNDILYQSSVEIPATDHEIIIHFLKQAVNEEFRFRDVSRSHCWTVNFEGRSLSLKLQLYNGKATWQLFIKPEKTLTGDSRIRQLAQHPIARMALTSEARHLLDGAWELCIPVAHSFSISINGRDEPLINSWFATLGLPEYLEQSKVFEYLDLSTDAAITDGRHVISLAGTYQLLPNCETASTSLHRKTTQEPDGSQIYFFLDPQRIPNPSPDRYVFAKTKHRLAWGEVREVIARLDAEWKPTSPNCTLKGTIQGEWIPYNWQLQPYTASQPISYAAMANAPDIEIPDGVLEQDVNYSPFAIDCNSLHFVLISIIVPIDTLDNQSWSEGIVSRSVQQAISRQFSWVFARLQWPVIFSDQWMAFPVPTKSDICQKCAPKLPDIRFGRSKSGKRYKINPYEDPKQAAKFEKKIKARLPIVISTLRSEDTDNGTHGRLDVGVNWASLSHRAMGKLPFQPHDLVELKGRIEAIAQDQSSIKLPKFTLQDSADRPEASYDFPTAERLRPEQKKALQQMLFQEDADALELFPEQAREEAVLRGYGLRVHALFLKYGVFLGGVLAHEVGFGKTAIVLALIDATHVPNSIPYNIHGKISSKATLILVPSTIVKQWQGQVSKFLGSRYKVVTIVDIGVFGRTTVGEIQDADIVIVNSKILNSQAYLEGISVLGNLPVQHNNSDRLFQAWYDWASKNMSTNIEDMKTNGLAEVSTRLTKKFVDTYFGDQLVRAVSSVRLRGQAYANDAAQRAKQDNLGMMEEGMEGADQDNEDGANEQQYPGEEDKAGGEQGVEDDEAGEQSAEEDGVETEFQDLEGLEKILEKQEPVIAYTSLTQQEEERIARQQAQKEAEAAAAAEQDAPKKKYEAEEQMPVPTEAEDNTPEALQEKARQEALREKARHEALRMQKRFKLEKGTEVSQMNFPILQMFHFHRIVIDEFTYVDDVAHILIAAILARRRWVLSGTPKLGDFMDIKKLARFIKFELGEDDDTPGVMKSYNVSKLRKEQTAAEEFRGLNNDRSMEFHRDRHLYAQDWLNRFARQDQPMFHEIRVVMKYEGIQLTATERARELEMSHLVQESQVAMKTPRSAASRLPDDKMDQIKSLMKGCTEPVQALLGITCEMYRPDLNGASSAAEASLNRRRDELRGFMGRLAYTLRKAVFLHGRFALIVPELADLSPWAVWTAELTTGKGAPFEVLPEILNLISLMRYDENDADIFMRADPKSKKEENSEDDDAKSKKKAKKSEEDNPNSTLGRIMRTLSILRDPREIEIASWDFDKYYSTIKRVVDECGHLADEMVRRIQAIRLAMTLLKCREWVANTQTTTAALNPPTSPAPPTCSVRRHPCGSPVTTKVLGSCGHIICELCSPGNTSDGDECPVLHCNAIVVKSNLYTAELLGTENHDPYATRHGAKVGKIIHLIKNEIPADEQVLLFVQEDRFMDPISKAFDAEDITHYSLSQKQKASHSKWMFAFQEDTGQKARKVLILDATKDTAAGANLTNANHVVFLSTLWTDDRHTYHQSLTQCIGRSKRFGQQKTVCIYRLIALNTVEVDVLEWREGKKLVKMPNGTFDLVEESQRTAEQQAMDFSTGFLRDNGYFERNE
ncbi:MAG: hypothetical protein Q9225_002711 [Loekoesia sp. 1 TL-2023]